MLKPWMLFLLVALPAGAEVQKCVNAQGRISYKDTPCTASERKLPIDRDYANDLPLAPSDEAREMLSNIAREREQRMRERVKRRNEAMERYTREFEAKKARCEQYKQEYDALHRFKRRNGNRVEDYESKLVHKMREACSS